MKTKHMMWVMILAGCYSGIANAETFSGTVSSIDAAGQNVTLLRADTQAAMTVHVADGSLIDNLAIGKETTWEASQMGSIWEASTFIPSDDITKEKPGSGPMGSEMPSTGNNNQSMNANSNSGNPISE